jgi:hypothetical protein
MAKAEKKKQPKKSASATGRVRKLTKKQTKQKTKNQARERSPLIGSFKLTWQVFKTLRQFWRPLGGIVLVYLILNIIFASGISNISSAFDNIKSDLNTGGGHALWHAAGGFGSLVGSAGSSTSSTGSTLQSILFVIESLVIIWALRHLLSGQGISVKMAYYRAMYPLIPFLLVIAVIIIQLLPVTIGGTILAAVATSVFTDTGIATFITGIFFVLLAAWSIYMICASVFAVYIVTLPDVQPRQALRSAKDLVDFRRALVIRRVLFLPVFIFVVMGLIIIPLIMFASAVVPVVFYILSMLAILFVHTYLYSLYRGLLE